MSKPTASAAGAAMPAAATSRRSLASWQRLFGRAERGARAPHLPIGDGGAKPVRELIITLAGLPKPADRAPRLFN